MQLNDSKELIPIWCSDCDEQGYIYVDDPEQSYFVICKACGTETSYVWCPNCEMGGEFVEKLEKHPLHWNCPECHTEYKLPDKFYNSPISMFIEENLPPDLYELVSIRNDKFNNLIEHLRVSVLYMKTAEFRSCTTYFLLLFGPWFFIFKIFDYVSFADKSIERVTAFLICVFWTVCCGLVMNKYKGYESILDRSPSKNRLTKRAADASPRVARKQKL